LVIALGTGSYAGLSSVTKWRRISTNDAYANLKMYDLRVHVAEGGTVPAGSLLAAARSIDDGSFITGANERLIGDVQVDASTDGKVILVPDALYGMDTGGVNDIHATRGRVWDEEERGRQVGLIERNFANHYGLSPEGTIRLGGGAELNYVGQALTPEYFLVTTDRGGLLAEANFAALFVPLETAQQLLGHPGMVNDLVLTLEDGKDVNAIAAQLRSALNATVDAGTEVTTRDDDRSFRLNDRDIDGDQQLYDIFAILIFAGAVVAAFNLTSRVMDAQRREIGIAMALGVTPWRIAIRPMLVGIEIALLGVLLGVAVGYALGETMMTLVRDLQPLPEWRTPFQWRLFATVAAVGFILPLIATAWPVWRAVTVAPVLAMRPAYRLARGGSGWFTRRLKLPGRTFMQMPVRNLVRSPRRTLLTALGISASLAALVAFVGMIDSFLATTERGDHEILGDSPRRVEIMLDSFYSPDADVVREVRGSPLLASSEPGARLGGTLVNGDTEIDIQLDLLDMTSQTWQPTITKGERDRATVGVFVSELAAKDLGVDVGSTVRLRHPRIDTAGQIKLTDTEVTVIGLHPHPYRFVTYMDVSHGSLFAPIPLTNRCRPYRLTMSRRTTSRKICSRFGESVPFRALETWRNQSVTSWMSSWSC
jgi:putative ABC transport system permease protein